MEHDHLVAMLNRLKLTAIRDQLDSLIDEAARRELTIREALSLFCEKQPPATPAALNRECPADIAHVGSGSVAGPPSSCATYHSKRLKMNINHLPHNVLCTDRRLRAFHPDTGAIHPYATFARRI